MDTQRTARRAALHRVGVACFTSLLWSACVSPSRARERTPEPVLNCCEGDVLLLLDSSGSVSSYEFSRLLPFLVNLLRPFQLGRGQVRVGLVQVGTEPRVEFDFDAYDSQDALQEALLRTKQLLGDTNTEEALLLAKRLLGLAPGHQAQPRVLLWLTDGVEPGNIDQPMAELRGEGVSVLAVSIGHTNYQVFLRAVTPPIESHLHFVDIDYISLITEDLREAMIELLCGECLRVRDVSTHSAVLQWSVLIGSAGHYEVQYQGSTESSSVRLQLSGDQSWTKLTNLQSDTHYTASLTAHTPLSGRTLTTSFRTLPEVLSPVTVTVSESGPDRVRVSWAPLQPGRVQRYLVEFGSIPRGEVRTVNLTGQQSSVLLTHLQPDTQYLITITAVHSSGQQRAMSVRACTQEVRPGLVDLQLTSVGRDSVKVDWQSRGEGTGLQGYWVSWDSRDRFSSSYSSSRYLPRQSLSTVLTHLSHASRVCVSPVYRTARGEGMCCTARSHTAGAPWE